MDDKRPLDIEGLMDQPKESVLYVPTVEDLGEDTPPLGAGPNEGEPEKKPGLLEVFSEMPTALSRFVVKNLLLTVGFIFAGILFFTMTWRTDGLVIFGLAAVWMAWNGLSVLLDYRAGRIIERVLICTGATYNLGGTRMGAVMGKMSARRVRVSFRDTNEELPSYYQYIVTDKVKRFVISGVYLTYVRASTPQILLTYHLL